VGKTWSYGYYLRKGLMLQRSIFAEAQRYTGQHVIGMRRWCGCCWIKVRTLPPRTLMEVTALHGAAESGHEAVVQLLLEKWRELSIEDPNEDAEQVVR
jgi:hypothetical protein